VVYPAEELARPRESPFGSTNGDLKYGWNLAKRIMPRSIVIANRTISPGLPHAGTSSPFEFIEQFNVPCYKIASASLTDDGLLHLTRSKGHPILMSTGMSTLEQVDHAVELLGKEDPVVMHTTSTIQPYMKN